MVEKDQPCPAYWHAPLVLTTFFFCLDICCLNIVMQEVGWASYRQLSQNPVQIHIYAELTSPIVMRIMKAFCLLGYHEREKHVCFLTLASSSQIHNSCLVKA